MKLGGYLEGSYDDEFGAVTHDPLDAIDMTLSQVFDLFHVLRQSIGDSNVTENQFYSITRAGQALLGSLLPTLSAMEDRTADEPATQNGGFPPAAVKPHQAA